MTEHASKQHYPKILFTMIMTGVTLFVLTPCAFAFKYDVLGILNKSCETGVGNVNQPLFSKTGTIEVKFTKSGQLCKGNVKMPSSNLLTAKGMHGQANLKCNDGSVINAIPVVDDLMKGHGSGTLVYPDRSTDKFYFVFASKGSNVKAVLADYLHKDKSQCSVLDH